jgi:hypothetical protein
MGELAGLFSFLFLYKLGGSGHSFLFTYGWQRDRKAGVEIATGIKGGDRGRVCLSSLTLLLLWTDCDISFAVCSTFLSFYLVLVSASSSMSFARLLFVLYLSVLATLLCGYKSYPDPV